MRRLLGRANSSNVMKAIWMLEHLRLPYEREEYGGAFGRTNTPDYLALNPNGVVPTLVEDGFVLWESNTILRYLAAAHAAGTDLCPADVRARANIDRWMDWQQTTLGAPMTKVFWGLVRTAPEDRDGPGIEKAAARLGELYGMLDKLLVAQPYVAGAALTPADMAIGVHAHRYMSFDGIDRPALPGVRAWYERLLSDPNYKRHVAIRMT